MERTSAVSIQNVRKTYRRGWRGRRTRALDGVCFELQEGEIGAFIGPNGSGKSTTMRILLGLLEADSGTAAIFGCSGTDPQVRRRVGFLPEAPVFYGFVSGREFVEYAARLCGASGGSVARRAGAILERVGLADASDRPIRDYSKGMVQRLGLAQAMVHNPDLLVLDEPMAGVDPIGVTGIVRLCETLRERGTTILLASHALSWVASLCDRVAIFDRGQILWNGCMDDLPESGDRWSLDVDGYAPGKRVPVAAALESCGVRLASVGRSGAVLERRFVERIETARGERGWAE